MKIDEIIKKYGISKADAKKLKEAFRAIEEEKSSFEHIIESAKDMVYTKDTELRFVYVNKATCRFLKRDRNDIIGKRAGELSNKELSDIVEDLDRKALNGEIVDVIDKIDFAGKTLWLHNIRFPIKDSDGKITGIGIITRVINDIKRIESELAQKKELIQMILDNIPASIFYKTIEDKIIHANRSYCDFVGVELNDIEGKSLSDIYQEESRIERYQEEDRQVIEAKKQIEKIEPIFREKMKWFKMQKLPVIDSNDDVVGILGFLIEVTEQKKTEDSLRLHSILLDSINESVMAMDASGHIVFWNKGAEKLYGYIRDEVMGKFFALVLDNENIDEELKRFEKVKDKGFVRGEFLQVRKDGSKFHSDKTISTIVGADGYSFGFMCLDRDISDKVEYRRELKRGKQLYQNFIKQSYDGIIIGDENGIIIAWNDAVEEITGYKESEALGKYAWDMQFSLLPEHERTAEVYRSIVKTAKNFMKHGTGYFVEQAIHKDIQHKDGTVKTAEIILFPIEVEGGYQSGTIIRDVTDILKAQKALAESEAMYRSLFDINLPSILHDVGGKIATCNDAFAELVGYDKTDIEGKMKWRGFMHKQDIKTFSSCVPGKTESCQAMEIVIIANDKTQKHTIAQSSAIEDTGMFISTFLDMTENLNLAEQLNLHELRISHAIEATNDVYWDIDFEEQKLIYASHNWITILGYEKDELPFDFKTMASLLHPDDLKEMYQLLNTQTVDSDSKIRHQHRVLDKSGRYRWFHTRGKIKSYSIGGKAKRVIGILREITEEKLEEQKCKAVKEAVKDYAYIVFADSEFRILDFINGDDDGNVKTPKHISEIIHKPVIDKQLVHKMRLDEEMMIKDFEIDFLLSKNEIDTIFVRKIGDEPDYFCFVFKKR